MQEELARIFQLNVSFLYPLNTSENRRFPNVFRGVQKGDIGLYWLTVSEKMEEYAGRTCKDIFRLIKRIINNGRYLLSLEQVDQSTFTGYCEMKTAGGGWRLVYSQNIGTRSKLISSLFEKRDCYYTNKYVFATFLKYIFVAFFYTP